MMKAYASFDDYERDQKPANRRIIRALRDFVRESAPKLSESVKWGNGCWLLGSAPVAYVYSEPKLVQFGFFRGAAFRDPHDLLEGKAQYVRHIKVRAADDIDTAAFTALLKQGIKHAKSAAR